MKFIKTDLKDAFIIELEYFGDNRGKFARTFCKKEYQQINHHKEFVQFNFSQNTYKGALRGMHYQVSPSCEIKLVRCIKGKIYDVIIDIREGSPTFLKHIGVELSEENDRMIYIPEGFAHGFQTLTNNCQLIYHHTGYYSPSDERGIRFNDPLIGIQWPIEITEMSEKDKNHKYLDTNFKGIKI